MANSVNDAIRAFESGDSAAAIRAAREALNAAPNDARLHMILGASLLQFNRLEEARASLERAAGLAPNQPQIGCCLSSLARREGNVTLAIREIDRTLLMAPGYERAVRIKAELLHLSGDSVGACALLDQSAARGQRSAAIELAFGLACANAGRAEEGVERLRALLATPGLSAASRATGGFRLGALLDRLGKHDEAWAAFTAANGARSRGHSIARVLASLDCLVSGWSPDAVARAPRASVSGERFVFVVGMPRSGTSLVEQILASHPRAFGAGEPSDLLLLSSRLGHTDVPGLGHVHHPERLTQAQVDEAARAYQRAAWIKAPDADRFIDKNPMNFQGVGLTQVLLPGSRVVWCRREPIDVCVSNYFQDFENGMLFATDLGQIAAMYRAHERVMEHWQSVFPDRVIELHYDRLVDHQEATTRALLDFVGLPWDERCLRFHESGRVAVTASNDQVRKPLYKSTGRYAPYEKYLGQLRKDLGLPARGV